MREEEARNAAQLLPKAKLLELVQQVDPNQTLDAEVEELTEAHFKLPMEHFCYVGRVGHRAGDIGAFEPVNVPIANFPFALTAGLYRAFYHDFRWLDHDFRWRPSKIFRPSKSTV